MATRTVATTDTLEIFRTNFNSLSGTDIGDPATLATTAKTIVAAINEINTSVAATGFTLSDGSTTQSVVAGNTMTVTGSSGISAVVSATDTLTLSLDASLGSHYFDAFGSKFNADGSNTYTEFVVTRYTKDSAHRYNGTGSALGYKIDGVAAPFLNLKAGNTYRFNQEDSTNSGHPLLFYYDAAKNTQFSTGVTTNGSPGSAGAYTQIVVSDSTPNILHYQCSVHGYMGNELVVTNTKVLQDTSFVTSTGATRTFASNAFAIAQAVALG
tara:strand:+ start:374 stop:1180 length:807 start_codon:yes stop_codon:yes gene_type:complete